VAPTNLSGRRTAIAVRLGLRFVPSNANAKSGERGVDPKAPVLTRCRAANANLRIQIERKY
jgi:hypothetical protein